MANQEIIDFQDAPRTIKLGVKNELAHRAVEIVKAYHPEVVLGAEIEAQITENSRSINMIDGVPLEPPVHISDASLAYALGLAVSTKRLAMGMRGNQVTYRLPKDPVEAGHVTT